MPTEIEQIEDLIILAVKTNVAAFNLVATWPDNADLDALLEETLVTPACYVIYAGERGGQKKTIGGSASDDEQTWRLTVINENIRSRRDGALGAYELLEGLKALLKGYKVTPLRGYLWPVSIELIAVRNAYYAYGMEFVRRTI